MQNDSKNKSSKTIFRNENFHTGSLRLPILCVSVRQSTPLTPHISICICFKSIRQFFAIVFGLQRKPTNQCCNCLWIRGRGRKNGARVRIQTSKTMKCNSNSNRFIESVKRNRHSTWFCFCCICLRRFALILDIDINIVQKITRARTHTRSDCGNER